MPGPSFRSQADKLGDFLSMSKLDDFKLDQVIGLGGSAIVFSACSKTAEREFNVSV